MNQSYRSIQYRNACQIQNSFLITILDVGIKPLERVAMLRAWLDLEWAKREWRFIPRLANHSMKELGDAKAALTRRLKPADASAIDAELDGKESLNPQTVPTPPTPEPPSGGGDLDNK